MRTNKIGRRGFFSKKGNYLGELIVVNDLIKNKEDQVYKEEGLQIKKKEACQSFVIEPPSSSFWDDHCGPDGKFQLVGGFRSFIFFFGPAGPVLSTSSKLLFHENENWWKHHTHKKKKKFHHKKLNRK